MSVPLVIYHAPCVDGWTCAWMMDRAFKGVQLHPGRYGEDPPKVDGRTVIIVDFSYPREVMEEMYAHAHNMLVLDHHRTAKENCVGLHFCIFDMHKCGARLVHQWLTQKHLIANLHPDAMRGVEPLVDYVEDRDLWIHERWETKAINAAIRSYPWTLDAYDDLATRIGRNLGEIVTEGKAIQRYRQQQIEQHVRHSFDCLVAGYWVPAVVCSCGDFVSDVLHELVEGRPFAISFARYQGGINCSLRSSAKGLDVSEIAELFGGGGHKHSAGFRMDGDTIKEFSPSEGLIVEPS